ncbi:MAG: threonine dehydratase [Alphaproteobacteria bacterium]|jgi:threonine dehydratase|nr:threonine dehydratase [Alphaproteobacteria bacterium]
MLPTLDEMRAAQAVVADLMPPTAQYAWPLLEKALGLPVWVKHENHTPIGAFKVRGGAVYMDALKRAEADCPGVIAATRGNHGQSIAVAAKHNGMRAVIVVPHGNNPEKNDAMAAQGAELVEHGEDFEAAIGRALSLAEAQGLHMVPSFDRALVAGVASYALELFENAGPLDAIYVPIGLGSGICGVIAAREALGLKTEVVGVQAAGAPSYALSFDAGHAVPTQTADTYADGLATRVPDEQAVAIVNRHAARIVTLEDEEILAAQKLMLRATHNLAEPAGAAPLAAAVKERDAMGGKSVAVILSGGNADAANLKLLADA